MALLPEAATGLHLEYSLPLDVGDDVPMQPRRRGARPGRRVFQVTKSGLRGGLVFNIYVDDEGGGTDYLASG